MLSKYISKNKMKKCLLTGAAGFIGSNFANYMANKYPYVQFVVLDRLDYCASLKNLVHKYHF